MKEEPNQALQPTRGTGSVLLFETSLARAWLI